MPDQIYIGNFPKGQSTYFNAFNIDNGAFPTLYNFYSWRGTVKRKRGTSYLGRLTRQLDESAGDYTSIVGTNTLDLFTGLGLNTVQPGASLVPGNVATIKITFGATISQELTDTTGDGTLSINTPGTITAATINYGTGIVTITSGAAVGPVTVNFEGSYYPGLPVMGLEDLKTTTISSQYPYLMAFDTTYAYQCDQNPINAGFYSVSYYKYSEVPLTWSAEDYQQFWTTNYPSTTTNFSGSLWATNNKPGFHYVNGTYSSGSPGTSITFNFKSLAANFTSLVVGDRLFFYEWSGSTINGEVGTVSDISGAASGNYVVDFTSSKTVAGTGIAQLLTNSISGQDGIRWYDGDPTSGTGIPASTDLGWVNFAPPLTSSTTTVSIDGTTADVYYLVGALAIIPFKDRLLFFSPYIQADGMTNPIQLQDVVLWSWNGTPYYNSVVPLNQTYDNSAYYVDQTGKGGYLSAGISQPIVTMGENQDVILVGFGGAVGRKTRFVYTGNDLDPFLFFNINSEYPSSSTFSAVVMDRGVIDIGPYGINITDQQSSQRIDMEIPDNIFQIQNLNNGIDRINSVRDFFNQWIYFNYPLNTSEAKFPTQTLMFNYADNTWAVLYENFTTQGTYRASGKRTWATTGFLTWNSWNLPWNSGSASPLVGEVIGGTPQGYVLIRSQGTGEVQSGYITSITNNGDFTQITSYDHCVSGANPVTGAGDYLYLSGAIGLSLSINAITLGTTTVVSITDMDATNTFTIGGNVTISGVVGTTELNGNTYEIIDVDTSGYLTITLDVDSTNFTAYGSAGEVTSQFNDTVVQVLDTIDEDNFLCDLIFPGGTYIGLGNFARLSQPLLQTKQFPVYWEEGRKVRLCAQKYLLGVTADSQITANIYLSQDAVNAWNSPATQPPPNGLVYSQVVYTCPESANIGLTPPNYNLQMPIGKNQQYIWHRYNTSLIGDTIQMGLTLSDDQMRTYTYATAEIALNGIQFDVARGPYLA